MPADGSVKLKEKVRSLPNEPGVYLMKDRLGRIIYVGKAKMLKKRVSSYFQRGRARAIAQPKIKALISHIHDFDTIEVKSEPEALLLESNLIKQWKPRYNTDFTDDKRFLLVRVDLSLELPRFTLTRIRKDQRSRYFGPFPHSSMLRKTLSQMRQKFGVLLADGIPQKQTDGRWQLYDDVRQDIYSHDNLISTTGYRHRVEQACEFLQGKSREWLESLRNEMQTAATKLHFEKAAELRDVISALEGTLHRTRKFERDQTLLRSDNEALTTLEKELKLSGLPQNIECFDISHISGTFVVASMVHFTEGRPDKDQYRRFKIKSFIGNDDYRAMEEVVGRRYRRLAKENKPMPDLVVIDGGRGQIAAALKAFIAIGVEPPALIGLAKKHETIIFPDERDPLNLSINDPGLNLLQRLRDEAHRFANTYNADLRSKKLRESILDDVPGLGPKRRVALLTHFGSIDKLRAASALDIAHAEGIGPKFAAELHTYLHRESTSKKPANPELPHE